MSKHRMGRMGSVGITDISFSLPLSTQFESKVINNRCQIYVHKVGNDIYIKPISCYSYKD